MKKSRRIQDALLATLAVLAIGTSGYAVWSVNRPHPSSIGAAEGTASSAVGDGADLTSASQPDPGVDVTASPTTSPSASAPADDSTATTGPPDSEPSGVAEWVDAWADESDLLVIGDGYSNLTTQWVQQWAALVGQERPVQIRHWGETEDRTFTEPIVLSEGEGPPLRVWSASRGGTTIAEAADRLERFDRASADPVAILVSLGMDSEGEDIGSAMDGLLAGLDDVPVLVAIAPEGLYEPGVADEIAAWAQDNGDRVAVLDLRESGLVEPTAEQWAQAFQDATRG